jgi:hypothetical protein
MTTSYLELTINDILALAQGDLDEMQLASRLSRRLALEVRRRTAALSDAQTQELANLELLTNGELEFGAAR